MQLLVTLPGQDKPTPLEDCEWVLWDSCGCAGRMERAGTIVALLDNAGLLATDWDLSPVCEADQCHRCLGCDCGCHRSTAPVDPPVLHSIPGGGTDA